MKARNSLRLVATAGASLAVVLAVGSQGAAQHEPGSGAGRQVVAQTTPVPCATATDMPRVPEIVRDPVRKRLKATVRVIDGLRNMWDSATPPNQPAGQTRCAMQYVRYFSGHTGLNIGGPDDPAFAAADPIPGPVLRARVGDWVEIAFVNEVDTKHFGKSLDRGDVLVPQNSAHAHGTGTATPDPSAGCDVTTRSKGGQSTSANGDTFPNCIHGSSTSNVHFHGTHTTPSTTGDNVLLFVRPAVRQNDKIVEPNQRNMKAAILDVLNDCEAKRAFPRAYGQTPGSWRTAQKAAIDYYDTHTAYLGSPPPLPMPARIGPVNDREISAGLWPQYSVGGTAYCFPLPDFDTGRFKMGQSPGTHWYHAHKHGSTALNVANGMVGALIIEGKYDDQLRAFYKSNAAWDFRDQVLVIQQLSSSLNKTDPRGTGPGSLKVPVLSVNGRRSPVLTMRPNQVQLFRLINGADRDAAYLQGFTARGASATCSRQTATPCVHWNQTAQDGVQFVASNYDPDNDTGRGYRGRRQDATIYIAPANRADLLVQAPAKPGLYDLQVLAGLCRQNCQSQSETLLTVSVEGTPVATPMPFVPVESFPQLPTFLADIPASDVFLRRELTFQDFPPLKINGKQFNDNTINQSMLLNAVEEWTIRNMDSTKEHPFHIHINPFQITEVFEPQSGAARQGGECYADPVKPETWRPYGRCVGPQKNFEWWDTFAIPASRTDTIGCTQPSDCPAAVRNRPELNCPGKGAPCTVTIPGHFVMRTRFVDFTGQYVLHCHILTHEDRGMMELIEVVPDTTLYTHH